MRFLPAAITPITWADLATAARHSLARTGTAELERELAAYLGARRAYTFHSLMRTTTACMLAIARGSRRRKAVLSRYSCPSFAHGIRAAGLEIAYCDTDPTTLAFDMHRFARIDLDGVAAVVCASLFGLVYPMDEILARCRAHDTRVVEGADYGLGSEYRGTRVGDLGDYAILNFQEGKALPIGGGAVVTDRVDEMDAVTQGRKKGHGGLATMLAFKVVSNPHVYDVFMLASRLCKTNLQKRFSMEDTIRKTKAEFDCAPVEAGRTVDAVSDFRAGLGAAVLRKMDEHARARERNAEILEAALQGIRGVRTIRRDPGATRLHFIRYPILVDAPRRDALVQHLLRNRVEASRMYVEHGMNVDGAEFPGAREVQDRLVTLPCHPRVTERDARRIGGLVGAFCGRA